MAAKTIISTFIVIMMASCYALDAQSTLNIRKALLIGNKNYTGSGFTKLNNTERDVDSMEIVLRKIGFIVTSYKNLDHQSFVMATDKFTQSLTPSDVSLIYYSGHGLGYQSDNYLLPIDVNVKCTTQLTKYSLYSLNTIIHDVLAHKVKANFIFLDACRDLPNIEDCSGSKGTKVEKGLVKPDNLPVGSLVAFATSEGKTADDNTYDQLNSLFTSELIKNLPKPNLGIRQILDLTKQGVLSRSNWKQNPQRVDELFGDYAFNGTVGNIITLDPSKSITHKPLSKMMVSAYKSNSKEIDYELTRMALDKLKEAYPDYNYDTDSPSGQKGTVIPVTDCIVTRRTSFRSARTVGYDHIIAETEIILIFKEKGKIVNEKKLTASGTDINKDKAEMASIERALQQLSN